MENESRISLVGATICVFEIQTNIAFENITRAHTSTTDYKLCNTLGGEAGGGESEVCLCDLSG